MIEIIDLLKKTSRLTEWWNYKISYLFIPFYLLLSGSDQSPGQSITNSLCLLGYFIATASFGHFVNDIGDAELDASASKRNLVHRWSRAQWAALLIALAGIQFLLLAGANADLPVFGLAILECGLFLAYSLPPTRLKESTLGILVDAAYAHVIPFTIAILIAPSPEGSFTILAWILVAWQACAGLRGIIGHELEDFASDVAFGARTAVIRLGKARSRKLLLRAVVPTEIFLLCLGLGWLSTWSWIPLFGFGLYLLFFLIRKRKASGQFDPAHRWDRLLDPFYRNAFPVLVLIGLILSDPVYWPFLIFHFIFFHLPKRQVPSGSRLEIPRSKAEIWLVESDGESAIEIEGAYLTSTLTDRTDVHIRLVISLDEREIPAKIRYEPNRFSDEWKTFRIEETPVAFRIRIPADHSPKHLSIEAAWENPRTRISLHSKNVGLPSI